MQNEQLVREFCAAWVRRDIAELLGYFAADAVYHNMPLEPLQGLEAIRATLEMFITPAQSIEFKMLAVASTGNLVFTERVDRFTIFGREVTLPVAGVFEIAAGKIVAWRDYFDMQTWLRQSGMAQ
ncbi:MAG: nuclear transport factor 2 family protein [Deltaproteobacteria bacterium]|nr:nuclear transport factor 2 family protein [Deltaproteobacteria bacterium]